MDLFTVKAPMSAARRSAPRLESQTIGRIPVGMSIAMVRWTYGEDIGGNPFWYGDDSGWVWSGSFEGPIRTWDLRES